MGQRLRGLAGAQQRQPEVELSRRDRPGRRRAPSAAGRRPDRGRRRRRSPSRHAAAPRARAASTATPSLRRWSRSYTCSSRVPSSVVPEPQQRRRQDVAGFLVRDRRRRAACRGSRGGSQAPLAAAAPAPGRRASRPGVGAIITRRRELRQRLGRAARRGDASPPARGARPDRSATSATRRENASMAPE